MQLFFNLNFPRIPMWMTLDTLLVCEHWHSFLPFQSPFCSLYDNELGPDGGKAFAKALETNKSLKSLEYDSKKKKNLFFFQHSNVDDPRYAPGMRALTFLSSLSTSLFAVWRGTTLTPKPKQPSRPPGAIATQTNSNFKKTKKFVF